MKKNLLILLMSIFCNYSNGQQTFSKVYYDSTDYVYGYSLARTYDSGYLVIGNKNSNGLLFKIDSAGALLWSKEYNFSNITLFKRIIATNDSCFVICGSVESSGRTDLLCMKVSSGGDTVWTKKFGGIHNMQAISVTQTYDGGYLLTGTVGYASAPYFKSLLLKLDSLGNHEWNKILTTGTASNFGYDVKQAPDSEFVFMGFTESGFVGRVYIIKMSPTGTISWSRKYSDTSNLVLGISMVSVQNGFACLLLNGLDYELMKIDSTGNIVFVKSYSNVTDFVCGGCFQPRFQSTSDHGYIIVTGTDPANGGGFGDYLIKVDSLGDLQWSQNIEMNLTDVCENADHGFTIAGNGPLFAVRGMSTTSNPQIGIVRIDSLGNNSACNFPYLFADTSDSLTVSVFAFVDSSFGNVSSVFPTISSTNLVSDSGCVAILGGFEEINAENFIRINPNPASSRIIFSFAKGARQYELSIRNILGQEVYSKLLTGEDTRSFSMNADFPPGMYIVVLSDGRFVYSKKLVIE